MTIINFGQERAKKVVVSEVVSTSDKEGPKKQGVVRSQVNFAKVKAKVIVSEKITIFHQNKDYI